MKDYYQILGVHRQAAPDEIKRAYRRMASQHHPDKGGDTTRFQEIEEAYRVLSDPDQRSAYDNPRPNVHMQFGPGGIDLDQIFSMFGHNMRQHHTRTPRLTLWIGLRDVAEGGRRTVALQIGNQSSNVEIDVLPGIGDGDTIRYPGLAPGGQDLIITFRIQNTPGWSREGADLTTEVDVSIYDLILGGDIQVIDIRNRPLLLTIPAGTQPGTALRMRGQGLPASTIPGRAGGRPGDMIVRVRARLPVRYSQEFLDAVKRERGQ